MPGEEIRLVELEDTTADVLQETLRQVGTGSGGPLMVLGLEKAISGSETNHPVLQALNLSRPEWPERIARSVVFWVPEYLLGLLGREAPDFMDWRSDTLFFLDSVQLDHSLGLWLPVQILDSSLTEDQRVARVEELRSRLAMPLGADDPVIVVARLKWMNELGGHLLFKGNLVEAERVFLEAVQWCLRFGLEAELANFYSLLQSVYEMQEQWETAEQYFRKSLEIVEADDDLSRRARCRADAVDLLRRRGDVIGAEDQAFKAIDYFRSVGNYERLVWIYLDLFHLYQEMEDEEKAKNCLSSALEATGQVCDERIKANLILNIAMLSQDASLVEEAALKAISVNEDLGYMRSVASAYAALSGVAIERGDLARAEQMVRNAMHLSDSIGYSLEGPIYLKLLKLIASRAGSERSTKSGPP